jgi:hypothetical protein
MTSDPRAADTSRYRLLERLGQGGMGEVFLAEDTQLGRKVASKFVSEGAGTDERALERAIPRGAVRRGPGPPVHLLPDRARRATLSCPRADDARSILALALDMPPLLPSVSSLDCLPQPTSRRQCDTRDTQMFPIGLSWATPAIRLRTAHRIRARKGGVSRPSGTRRPRNASRTQTPRECGAGTSGRS